MQKLSLMSSVNRQVLLLGFHLDTSDVLKNNNPSCENLALITKLIELINKHNELKASLHISGHLLTHLDSKVPDFSPNIRLLLEKSQIELFSGGIYEPIFSITPREDRQIQILNMSRLLNHMYGYTPLGAWITELSWETAFAQDLSKARIQYTCLPKEYFTCCELADEDLGGYYITEDEARKIGVFPITHNINFLMKNHTPNDLISSLLHCKKQNNGNTAKIIFYSGNKINEGDLNWVQNFLDLIASNPNLLETKLFHEYYHHSKPNGRIYLTPLQNDISTNIFSFRKHTLLNNHAVNLLHKKMLRTSKKINSAKEGKSRFKVIKEMISQAQDLLLKAQCNYAYWTNSEEGIYLPQERHFVYSNLIKAENLIDAASRYSSRWIHLYEIDYDCDGNDEIIIETETQNIYISTHLGGSILEHDFRQKNINITNTLPKHKIIHELPDDTQNVSLKSSVKDHFLEATTFFEDYKNTQLNHLTNNTVFPYFQEKIKAKEEICRVALKSIINLEKLNGNPEIEITKQYSIKSGDSSLIIDYLITNKSKDVANFVFGVELNYNISPQPGDINYTNISVNQNNNLQNYGVNDCELIKETKEIVISNTKEKIDLKLSWSKAGNLIISPIISSPVNHQNKNEIYQGTTILPMWSITLPSEDIWDLSIKQDINFSTIEF